MNIWLPVNKIHRAPALPLKSGLCTQAQLLSPIFQGWVAAMHEQQGVLHRKQWEFAFIAQALHERGMLQTGKCGVGFAVGREPLPALFAARGCEILATDLGEDAEDASHWIGSAQHAGSLAVLNERALCAPDAFERRVRFRPVDMRALPPDLGEFDFVWSSCSMEHLGSLEAGKTFVMNALRHLKPGGVAIHTTEINVSSNTRTQENGIAVVYRRRDLRELARRLRAAGMRVTLDLRDGRLPADRIVDLPPYDTGAPHLKLALFGHVSTSFGLIIEGSATKFRKVGG